MHFQQKRKKRTIRLDIRLRNTRCKVVVPMSGCMNKYEDMNHPTPVLQDLGKNNDRSSCTMIMVNRLFGCTLAVIFAFRFNFITARVRSTREGNIYTWECLSVHHWWRGTLSQVWAGGTPSQVWVGGYPVPGLGRGVPRPRSGGYPIPGLGGGYPIPGRGYPVPGLDGGGYPPGQVWMVGGYPRPGLDGGGVPPARSGFMGGYLGYPPTMTRWGTPPP